MRLNVPRDLRPSRLCLHEGRSRSSDSPRRCRLAPVPRLRRQDRRPVPRLAGRPTSGRRPRRRASPEATFDAAFAGVDAQPEAARSRHAGRRSRRRRRSSIRPSSARRATISPKRPIGAVDGGGRARAGQLCQDACRHREAPTACRAAIVLAIWGRESGFGSAKMPYDAFEVLGTKAFLSTRKDMFRTELLAALEIVETRPGEPRGRCDRPGPARSASRNSCRPRS